MTKPASVPARRASAGQPAGLLVDRDYVLERMAALQLDRREMVKRAGHRISPRTLQRVINTPGARLSLSSAAALAEVLECGSRDPLDPAAPVAERIASFGLCPHPPVASGAAPARRPWVARAEEAAIEAGLAARRPVVVHAPARGGKTSLARRIAHRQVASYPRGVLWLEGDQDPDRARAAAAECLGLFHPYPAGEALPRVLDERFARVLWARRRLLIVDDARDGAQVLRLLGRYRGPMDLIVLTDREEVVLALERDLGHPAVALAPLSAAQVIAALLARHPDDERLLDGAGRRAGLRAQVEAALAGEPAALAALAAVGEAVPGWRPLLEAIAGRPDAVDFASDQLRLTRLATLEEIAARVGRSASVNSPLLSRLAPEARRFFLRLGALDGHAVPLDWAAAAGGVAVDEARRLCDELSLVLQHHDYEHGGRGVSISPHLRQFAASALPAGERADAERRLLLKAREDATAIGMLPPPEAMPALRAAEPLLLLALGRVGAPGEPGGAGDADRARLAIEVLSPVRHLFPAWRAEALGPALAAALAGPADGERVLEAHRLRLAKGRWLIAARGDHGRAGELARTAAEGLARIGRHLEAADARIEQGISLFATRRGAEALPVFREALALARLGQAPIDVLARQLVNVAFAESRRRAGRDGRTGWRAGLSLLDEAAALLRRGGGAPDAPLARIVAVDRAVAAMVLGRRGWRRELAGALGELLSLTGPEDVFRAYLLATATGAGLALEGPLPAQRRRARELWWSALEARGFAVSEVLRRIGQMAYYLGAARAGGQGGIRLVNEGTVVTDPPLPVVARYGASIATLFLVEPVREVFDAAFVDAAERFVWEQGGPNQTFTLEVLEQLRAGPPARGRSAARG